MVCMMWGVKQTEEASGRMSWSASEAVGGWETSSGENKRRRGRVD